MATQLTVQSNKSTEHNKKSSHFTFALKTAKTLDLIFTVILLAFFGTFTHSLNYPILLYVSLTQALDSS